jgi:hypothetical protein
MSLNLVDREGRDVGSVTAVYRSGQLELAGPVNWPDGTRVEVTPIANHAPRVNWLSLPPLDAGEFRELDAADDLLAEMLDALHVDASARR